MSTRAGAFCGAGQGAEGILCDGTECQGNGEKEKRVFVAGETARERRELLSETADRGIELYISIWDKLV